MKSLLYHVFRRAGFILGIGTAAALGLGLTVPASASQMKPVPSVSFDPTLGVMTVTGDDQHNTITIGRTSAGRILVNGQSPSFPRGPSTIANTRLINVFGQGGHDIIGLDEPNGVMPKTNLFGGTGNDTLMGGAGDDHIFGQVGHDKLLGKGGIDVLLGGADGDVLTGGDGNDQSFGESGSDRIVSNPGDDTDLNEGGNDIDTIEVTGSGSGETFTATANGTRVRFDQLSAPTFALDIGGVEKLVLNAGGGGDTFAATGNLGALIQLSVNGGMGNDTLRGSNGADELYGGEGNDTIDGNQGNDRVFLGTGDDTFQWDPGDGIDTVEGQVGADQLHFNGSGAAESFDVSPNGERVRFVRDVASIVLDLNDIESIDLNTLGGSDTLTINDLAGTDLTRLKVNLAGALAGTAGDAQPDKIIVKGADRNDDVDILGSNTSMAVAGLPTSVTVTNHDGASDTLVVQTIGGDDTITARALAAGPMKLAVEGGLGADTLRFAGSNANENFDMVGNAGRVSFFCNRVAVTMDLDDVETLGVDALGGSDTIFVGELTGTDLTAVHINLMAADTGAQPDSVIVNGTNSSEVIKISGSSTTGVTVAGSPATVNIKTLQGANTALSVNSLGGADQIDASGLAANLLTFAANGGLGVDVILGSQGNDLVRGGDGNDLAMMSDGDDTFVWEPGDDNDVVEGQAGFDTLRFNGSNAPEQIDISAHGGRVRFLRDLASVTMDLGDVDRIDFNALGGVDAIIVNDVSGTGLTEVNLNLAAVGSSGDGHLDSVLVNATDGDDAIVAAGNWSGTTVRVLAATVNITGVEMDNDGLIISARAGDDTVDASELTNGAIQLTTYGGDDDDVLIGGDNADVLSGDDGDDVLRGGPGVDVLDGGAGNNIVTQD